MRVKNNKRVSVFGSIMLAMIVAFFPFNFSQAADVSFGQSILPVRFIYLNQGGQITRIWSNVSENDSRYAIKYFDERSQKELAISNNLFYSYQNIIRQTQLVDGNIRVSEMKIDTVQNNLAVDFVKINNMVEEVRTLS